MTDLNSPYYTNPYFRGAPRIKNLIDQRHMETQNAQMYTPYKTSMHMDAPASSQEIKVPVQKLWLDDPGVLIRSPMNIFPYPLSNPIERVNSATRAVLLLTGVMSAAEGVSTPLMYGLISVVLFSLYFSDHHPDTLSVIDITNVARSTRAGGISNTQQPEQVGRNIKDLMNGPVIDFSYRSSHQRLNL